MGKTCCACGKWKAINEYGKWTKGADGYRPRCKECTRERQNESRFLERRKAYMKLRYAEILEEIALINGETDYEQYDAHSESPDTKELLDRIFRGDYQFSF